MSPSVFAVSREQCCVHGLKGDVTLAAYWAALCLFRRLINLIGSAESIRKGLERTQHLCMMDSLVQK